MGFISFMLMPQDTFPMLLGLLYRAVKRLDIFLCLYHKTRVFSDIFCVWRECSASNFITRIYLSVIVYL